MDDTARIKALEVALEKSQSRFNDFVELAPDYFWETDENAIFTYISENFSDLAGRSVESFIGQNSRKLFPRHGTEDEVRAYTEGAEQNAPFEDALLRFETFDKNIRYLMVSGRPFFSAQGIFSGYRGYSSDITQRVELKRDLTEKLNILEEAAKLAHIGYWHFDYPTKEFFWSDEIYRISGLSPEHGISLERGFDIYTEVDRNIAKKYAEKSRKDGNKYQLDLHVVRPNGDIRNVILTGNCDFSDTGDIRSHYGILQDVTDKVAGQNRQLKLEKQLMQSQKIEMIGRLTGGIAHEFNNLLSVIIGNIEILNEQMEQDSPHSLLFQSIERSAEKGAKLTQRLLAYSRKLPLFPEKTDLVSLIESMENSIKLVFGKDIALRFDLTPDVWPVLIDPRQLEKSIINLCHNAHEAMPDGGRCQITIDNQTVKASQDRNEKGLVVGDYVILSLQDTGFGMDKFELSRAFEPFFTTKDTSTRSGLGLSFVYGFLRQSNGYITLSSQKNSGTHVQIYLPAVRG